MRRGWFVSGHWFEAWLGPLTVYVGVSRPFLLLTVSVGVQTFITIGPVTVGIDFD